jgi:DNA helicase-2/ATP-dependent DNA helicase PcrA
MVNKIEREIEEQYLGRVISVVETQLSQRRYQSQDARSSLYGKPYQDYTAEVLGKWAVKNADKATETLEQQREAPYFGRIDFQEADQVGGKEVYYIGKASVWDKNDLIVVDWRAPISSMYYSHSIGPAEYLAPDGCIQGNITLRRQFTFSGSTMKQIHETGGTNEYQEEAVDELLLSILRRNASGQMRQIVQSIQKEQDQIVRNRGHIVVIQGPAGSGKTIIALHRAAYLLYQMREGRDRFTTQGNQISARRMLVFSPNAIFSDYISQVLPDLQEDGIQQVILDRHIHDELKRKIKGSKPFEIEQKEDHYEYMLLAPSNSIYTHRALTSKFKLSALMIDCIRAYVDNLDDEVEGYIQDVILRDKGEENNVVIFARQELIDQYRRGRGQYGASVLVRLNQIIAILEKELNRVVDVIKKAERPSRTMRERDVFEVKREAIRLNPLILPLRSEIARLKSIFTKHQQSKLTDHYLAMLRHICSNGSHFVGMDEADNYHLTESAFSDNHVLYEDVLPLLLLDGFYRGFTMMGGLNHAIVDEAQDYSLLHFEYVKNCLPEQCSMTIVGDINQGTNPQINLPDYDSLSSVYQFTITRLELTRSYRSSSEITAFASRILGNQNIDNVRRTGRKPTLVKVEEKDAIQAVVASLVTGHINAGAKTVAVLCKTRKDCEDIYPLLKAQNGAKRLTNDSENLSGGVIVLPVYLAKGLEFDAVIISDADAYHYGRDTERRLLYTACTRALHELTLVYAGEPSPLLPIKQHDLYETVNQVSEHSQLASKTETIAPNLGHTSRIVAETTSQRPNQEYLPSKERSALGSKLNARRKKLDSLVNYFDTCSQPQVVNQCEEHLIAALLEQDRLEQMYQSKCTVSRLEQDIAACGNWDEIHLPKLQDVLLTATPSTP